MNNALDVCIQALAGHDTARAAKCERGTRHLGARVIGTWGRGTEDAAAACTIKKEEEECNNASPEPSRSLFFGAARGNKTWVLRPDFERRT